MAFPRTGHTDIRDAPAGADAAEGESPPQKPLLTGSGLRMEFRHGRRRGSALAAVDGVELDLFPGETLGVVGESGSGKSTLARVVMRLLTPTAGRVTFDGQDISSASRRQLRPLRDRVQIVFQDPFNSLNPRLSVADNAAEPLRVRGVPSDERRRRVADLFAEVGLGPQLLGRLPGELSGGQLQRVGIARALSVDPDILVLDEPVSALDVSIQAQILNLLRDLQAKRHLAYLFISHDMSVVRYLCHRVAVMYLGRVVEVATANELFESPKHPYTKVMLAAIPDTDHGAADPDTLPRAGELAVSATDLPGCRFMPRCPVAVDECARTDPQLAHIKGGRQVACLVSMRQDGPGEHG